MKGEQWISSTLKSVRLLMLPPIKILIETVEVWAGRADSEVDGKLAGQLGPEDCD